MSSEDRPVLPAPSAPSTASIPVYTVYPVASGERRGNANQGFHGSCPQEPPPKYEDVISGNYLKENFTNYRDTASPISSTAQLSLPPSQPEPLRQDNHKGKKQKSFGAFLLTLCTLLITVIFIWRVSIM